MIELALELRRMLTFWRWHHNCPGFREVKAFDMYMLWCPIHQQGESTG